MNQQAPPQWIERLLERFLTPGLFRGVWGDLLEEYHENQQQYSSVKARRMLVVGALGYLRFPALLKMNFIKSTGMNGIWSNYLLASFRNLTRNKQNTALSLIGLVASFVAFMAIAQYVYFERSYDGFHKEVDRLYRVSHVMKDNAGSTDQAATFYAAKDFLEAAIPEIEKATHVFAANRALLQVGDQLHQVDEVLLTKPGFFEMFHFPVVRGNLEDLANENVVFLSSTVAERLFRDNNPIGEVMEVQGVFGQTWNARVAGVYEDMPENSHLWAEIILPLAKLEQLTRNGEIFGNNITLDLVQWRWMSFHTYVRLIEDASISDIEKSANEIVATNRSTFNARLNQEHTVWLQDVRDIHTRAGAQAELKPTNDANILNLLLIVAIGVMVIGWINYINLGTARSISRGKEVGVRKVLGSSRSQLKIQFQTESFMLSLVAVLLALLILIPLRPLLEGIVQVPFFHVFILDQQVYLVVLGLMVFGSVISGYYPAQVLSGYKIVDVIKGKLSYSKRGILLRRLLVTVQFGFSLLLLSALLVVHDQMNFLLSSQLGVNIERKILLDGPTNAVQNEDYISRMRTLKNDLLAISGVEQVSVSSIVPGIQNGWLNSTENTESAGVFTHRSLIDEDYIDMYDLEIVAGRPLSRDHGMERTNILINEHLASRLGHNTPEEAIHEEVVFADASWKIVGVVKDFYQRGVQVAIEPMTFNLDTAMFGNFITLEVVSSDLAGVNQQIKNVFLGKFPDAPFRSRFLDAVFEEQYQQEERFRSLLSLFTSVAVVIACLGVLGLASYIMNQRLKEISIRKVLGARIGTLFMILNREYLVVGGIAFVLAIPTTYYLMSQWLDGYANRISVSPQYFVLPILFVVAAILVTTLRYTLRVIFVNPAETLKDEG